MGSYLYTGIVSEVKARSREGLENYSFLPLELYDVEEDSDSITITLKKDILSKDNLIKFLDEQYSEIKQDNKDKILEKIAGGEGSIIDIIKGIEESRLYVVEDYWQGTEVQLIAYISDGKFEMETYTDTLNYYLYAIRKSSNNPLIKTVDFLIC